MADFTFIPVSRIIVAMFSFFTGNYDGNTSSSLFNTSTRNR